jgi:hypothetical protein
MPDLTLRLDAPLKIVPHRSGDRAEVLSQASGPAESLCPAEPVHAEAQRRLGPMKTKIKHQTAKPAQPTGVQKTKNQARHRAKKLRKGGSMEM